MGRNTYIIQGGGRPPGFPHLLHAAMTLATCGLWFPVWVLHYTFRQR